MKRQIKNAFNKAANTYDAHALLQQEIAVRLVEQFDLFKIDPKIILDVGSGTGQFSKLLVSQYPKSNIIQTDIAEAMLQVSLKSNDQKTSFVCSDVEALAFKENSVDLVVSNLMLQWLNPLDKVFSEIKNTLNAKGLFVFSTFGPNTLKELRDAWSEVDQKSHTNPFIDMHDVGEALQRNGFITPVLSNEVITLQYKNLKDLFIDLKKIGANTVTEDKRSSLTGRKRFQAMQNYYETKRDSNGFLPVTYEVIYAHGWAGNKTQNKKSDKQIISLNKMKEWLKEKTT